MENMNVAAGAPRAARVLLLAGLAACGPAAPHDTGVVTRDSAGVTITESPAMLAARELGWEVEGEPEVRIGVVEGEAAYQLFRVAGAAVQPGGGVVVVNGGTSEVRFFDASGRHTRSVGGRGAGPGEFMSPQLVGPAGDSIIVGDLMNNRFTMIGPDGGLGRMITPQSFPGTMHGWLGDGLVLQSINSARAGFGAPEGIMPNNVTYGIFNLDSGTVETFAELPGTRVFLASANNQIAFTAVPFDPAPASAAAAGAAYLTPGTAAEVRVHTPDGRLDRIFRVLEAPRVLTRQEFDRLVDQRVQAARTPEQQAEQRRRHAAMPVPETVPFYDRLLVDDGGQVWARRFAVEPGTPSRWTVFAADGTALGTVSLPAGLQLLQVGPDFVLGQGRDALDVEYIARHRLARN